MTDDLEDDFNPELRDELRAMKQSPEPPPGLESRVVDSFRARGLFAARRSGRALWVWPLAAAAACLLSFAAGIQYAKPRTTPQPAPSGNQYVLLMQDSEKVVPYGSPEEAVFVQEYSAWAQQQRLAGHLFRGEKLQNLSVALSGPGGSHEVRATETSLGGFFLISAANLDDAIVIARTCPHLQHGGTVVIRPIDPTPPPPSAH